MKKIFSSLANTISVMIILILLLVFSVLGFFLTHYSNSQFKEDLTIKINLKSQIISKDIKAIFSDANIVTHQMSLQRDLIDYLKTAVDQRTIRENPYYAPAFETLVKIKKSKDVHFLTWVANEKANFYLDSNGVIPDTTYDVKKRPWYDVAMKADGKVAFTPPYVEWGTGEIVVSSIMALKEHDEVYGFVVVDLILNTIPEIMEKVNISDKDINLLVTKEGNYISSSNSDKAFENSITDEGDPLQAISQSILNSPEGIQEVVYKGKPYLLYAYPVGQSEWIIITLIDEAIITEQTRLTTLFILLLMLTAFCLSVLAVRYVVNRFTKPYKVIQSFANDIAMGDFSKNIPDNFTSRQDEVGDISHSFQLIIDAFRNENILLEQKIVEKNAELEERYKYIVENEKMTSLGSLVAGIAHEINTPLGISVSAASYLEKINYENREKLAQGSMNRKDLQGFMESLAESIELINNNLKRSAELVKSFKQVAVDQSGEFQTKFNLHENISVVLISLKPEYKRTRHVIENNCPIDIELDSFPGAFSQIFTNLVMNSLHHGFSGIEEGKITIHAAFENQQLVIIYQDNGVGISEENLKKIYDPFFTTNRQNGNSGLGLHIIYNIVTQKLKGTIRCESKLGEGVIFTLRLPL